MLSQIQGCVRQTLRKCLQLRSNKSLTSISRAYSVFGPDDVNLPPEIPEYDALNIRLRAYDFVTLESYAKYVHNTTKRLGIDSNVFAVPARTSTVQTFTPSTTIVQTEHHLARYERTVQVEGLPSTLAPILFEVITQNLPEGVQITIKEPDVEEDEFRYVPDVLLNEMHDQISELDKAREDRRR